MSSRDALIRISPPGMSITTATGPGIRQWIPALSRLRIRVFREFPYLYDGTEDYERHYLETYLKAHSSIAVMAICDGEVIGASTGLAMADEETAFIRPFAEGGYCLEEIFYCGESVLLPEYRGMGIYKQFFQQRERHARALGGMKLMTFCAVQRPDDHPLCPRDYRPLDAIWRHFGYRRQAELNTTFDWKDIDEQASTPKPMAFYTKPLD